MRKPTVTTTLSPLDEALKRERALEQQIKILTEDNRAARDAKSDLARRLADTSELLSAAQYDVAALTGVVQELAQSVRRASKRYSTR